MNLTEYEMDRFRCTLARNLYFVGELLTGGAAFVLLLASSFTAVQMLRGNASIVHVLALLVMAGALGMTAAALDAAYEIYANRRRNGG